MSEDKGNVVPQRAPSSAGGVGSLFGVPDHVESALTILDSAIEQEHPTHVFAMFSGGHDSVCSTFLTSQHPKFSGVVHINTGIGIEQTRQYVRNLCAAQRWPLLEMHPPKLNYADLIRRFGFPGPGWHSVMFRWLKQRAVEQLVREHKRKWKDRIALVTGIRKQESGRRKWNVDVVPTWRNGAQLWVNALYDWQATDRLPFMAEHGLPRNRVVDILHMSGECLCGAYASPGERELIRDFFPDTEQQIQDLEAAAREAGQRACVWGQRPPRAPKPPSRYQQLDFFPLCAGCPARDFAEAVV